MENKMIFVYIIGSLFQSLASTYILLKQEYTPTKIKKIIFFILMWGVNVISAIFVPNQLRFIYSITSLMFILYFLGVKDRRTLLYSFCIMIYMPISEIIVSIILVGAGVDSKTIVTDIFYNLLATILISLIAIILVTLFKKITIKLNNFFIKNKKAIYYLYLLMALLYILVSKNGLEFILKSNYYLNILIIIGVLFLFISVVMNERKTNQLQEMNKQAMNYIKKYEKIITEQGIVNHEFKNQLMVISGYAKNNPEKLEKYLDEVISDSKKSKSTYLISQLNLFPDGGIKGMLYYKLSIMEELGIKCEIYSSEKSKNKCKKIDIEQLKYITKITGVLLDNAIDAAKECQNKEISITLSDNKNVLSLSIVNSYKGKIDVSKLGTGYTTKGKGHGYGLRLINEIINTNNNISIEYKVTDKYYEAIVNMDVQKKKK